MDNERLPYTPFSDRRGLRAIRLLVVLLIAFVVICLFVAVVLWLQGFDEPSDARAGNNRLNISGGGFPRKQRRQLLRCGLQKVDQQAQRIWEDIDELETEIELWQKQFDDLKTSEIGSRLIKDDWTVRYFYDFNGHALPHHDVANDCRDNLNTLMVTVQEALADDLSAYEVNEATKEEIDTIERQVGRAKEEYSLHRHSLEGLTRRVSDARRESPETLEEAVKRLAEEESLWKLGHPSAKRRKAPPPQQSDVQPVESRTVEPPPENGGGLDDVYRQIYRKEADVPADFSRATQTGERGTESNRSRNGYRPRYPLAD